MRSSKWWRNLALSALSLTLIASLFTPITQSAQAVDPTCAQGGVCAPGDIGPGGGLVFYVSNTPFYCGPSHTDDCNYLEAAPKTWGGGATDPTLYWHAVGEVVVNGISRDSSANMSANQFGLGYKNSNFMAAADSTAGNAAVAARAYTGGSKSDWYLPTIAELGILCQYAHGQTPAAGTACNYNQALNTGIPSAYQFAASSYQSSSQSGNAGSAQWHENFVSAPDGNSAEQSTWGYAPNQFSTRAIRAGRGVNVSDGNINCGTSGTFAISNKAVTSSISCIGTVTIPYGVTAIASNALSQSGITSVTIPTSVVTVADSAFALSGNLTSITFNGYIRSGWPWSAPAAVAVTGRVACGTTGYFVIQSNVATGRHDCTGSVVIPTGVTSIADQAFDADSYWGGIGLYGNFDNSTIPTSISSMIIPNTVTTIGEFAFRNLRVTRLDIPNSVTSIARWAFAGSTTMETLTVSSNVATIPEYTFAGLTNLKSLTLPEGITTIQTQAFADGLWTLPSLTLPNSLTTIGSSAFTYMRSLTSLTLGTGLTTVGDYAFIGALNLPSLTIPNNVTSIGTGAFTFDAPSSLATLTIGQKVATIGESAFAGARIRELEIPGSVTTVGNSAFASISQLETLTIANSVTALGTSTFAQSQSISRFNYCGSLTSSNLTTAGIGYLHSQRTCGVSAPSAPTSVSATITGTGSASVSFTAPTSNGGAAISSYTATSSPGNISSTIYQAGSGTISLTGLSNSTSYTFTVVASNWGRTSSASLASSPVRTPGVPTEPTGVRAVLIDSVTATVSFSAPSSNGGAVIDSYTAISTPDSITASVNGASSGSITVTGLTAGTNYIFRVLASNSFGDSALSAGSDEYVDSQPQPSVTSSIPDPVQQSRIDTFTVTTIDQKSDLKILGSFVEEIRSIQLNGAILPLNIWKQSGTSITFTLSSLKPGNYEIQIYNGASPTLKPQNFKISSPAQPVSTTLKTRKKLITCVKGINQKLIYSVNPVCPAGFKKK